MRESVIDVLFYLFDDLLNDEQHMPANVKEMTNQLNNAGFTHEKIGQAVEWFMELSKLNDFTPKTKATDAIRVFSERECRYIDAEGLDYLRGLYRQNVISADLIEKIVDRALALEEPLDIHVLRWVTAMVVLNVYGQLDETIGIDIEDSAFWPPIVH